VPGPIVVGRLHTPLWPRLAEAVMRLAVVAYPTLAENDRQWIADVRGPT